jgi:prolyl oligopeptidase
MHRPPACKLLGIFLAALLTSTAHAVEDPYISLEKAQSPEALAWAEKETDRARTELSAKPEYAAIKAELEQTLSAAPPAPLYSLGGPKIVRTVRDVAHPFGVVEIADRGSDGAPGAWRVALDLNQLRKAEGKPYLLRPLDLRTDCLPPDFNRCMLNLSVGGTDDSELREFDLTTGQFVAGGFQIKAGRAFFAWLDSNRLLISSTQFADPRTASGFANAVHLWSRGQSLHDAPAVWRGAPTDQFARIFAIGDGPTRQGVISRVINLATFQFFLVDQTGATRPVDLPTGVNPPGLLATTGDQLIFETNAPHVIAGVSAPENTLIAYNVDPAVSIADRLSVVYAPAPGEYIATEGTVRQIAATKNAVNFIINRHLAQIPVHARLERGKWLTQKSAPAPLGVSTGFAAFDPESDDYVSQTIGFTVPERLELIRDGKPPVGLYAQAPIFDARNYMVEVRTATSRDGAHIDYYLLRPKQPAHPGLTPTLITGYGAFGLVYQPGYFGYEIGGAGLKVWLSRGGALALPIIRGGGERGSAWHRAAMGQHRQLSYDDFLAVTADLEKHFTSAVHLGVFGNSNGGLLAATVAIERPDLYGAAVSDVPLTDMLRMKDMGMGAAYLTEYGDPTDPAIRAAMLKYSPYQNVRPGVKYPPFLITTSTADTRVGPGHARKLAARLAAAGSEVWFYEDQQGGHGVSDPLLHPDLMALRMTFLVDRLMSPAY